jgi:hypothetical protein
MAATATRERVRTKGAGRSPLGSAQVEDRLPIAAIAAAAAEIKQSQIRLVTADKLEKMARGMILV